jgi:hypothetical protein
MKSVRWILCLGALSFAACGVDTSEQESGAVVESSLTAPSEEEVSPGAPTPSTVTCTETFGECKVGPCELGPRDRFQIVTTTCCNTAGSCTITRFRLCGC